VWWGVLPAGVLAVLVAIVIIVLVGSAKSRPTNMIVGDWEPVSATHEVEAAQFFRDGTVSLTFRDGDKTYQGATYKFVGDDRVFITSKDGRVTLPLTVTFLSKDEMVTDAGQGSAKFIRVK
jgi:uncharacterized protein (TIGR03066 family)